MIRILDVVVDSKATVGNEILLADVVPAYSYKEGVGKTDVVDGYYYLCALPKHRLRKIKVKIPGKKILDAQESLTKVMLADLEIKLYVTKEGECKISATAKGIQKV